MRIRTAVALALLLTATPLCAQTVRVWDAPLSDDMMAADPADVVALFAGADYDAATISTDVLLDPAQMAPDAIDLLVIPAQGSYPADGLDPLADYLRGGGRALAIGGVPFSSPLIAGPNGWEQVSVPAEPPAEVRVIADFEDVTPEVTIRGGEDEPIEWESVEADGGEALRASVEDLQQWQYVEIPVADTGDATLSVLRFRARGDSNTPILGLELTEDYDSRWKHVIPLSEDWREYRI
ncbi:MAG: hypothetical protein GF393_07625, partial [Armatimonadia bacterium]|nr:hypothetical protein [Armatimonadia bacterium]